MKLLLLAALLLPEATVKGVIHLDRAAIGAARSAGLPGQISALIADAKQPLSLRLHGARALGRLGGEEAIGALAKAAVAADTPEQLALAREAARALKQLRAYTALAPAMQSPDPEVRAFAAVAGGDPACTLVRSDPWPMVRAAAATGLQRGPAACLAEALSDLDARVATAAAAAAAKTPAPALRKPLRRLAGKASASIDARAHAFVALAGLGDLEPATRALDAHLKTRSIEPLALAAVRAFAVGEPATAIEPLRRALTSEAPAVVQSAARALLIIGTPQARQAVAERAAAASGQLKVGLERLQREFRPPADLGDPAAHDPE